MLNVDVTIERISNGFIVTNNDSSKTKTYYASLVDFYRLQFDDFCKDKDKEFRECDTEGEQLIFRAEFKYKERVNGI